MAAPEFGIDEAGKPARAWVNPIGSDSTYINLCFRKKLHGPETYGNGTSGNQECCRVLYVQNQETLVNLYNALHEALVERELK